MSRIALAHNQRLIVALDVPDVVRLDALVDATRDVVDTYKIGARLFTSQGPRTVSRVQAAGAEVFLDLKFHDIPNTVGTAVAAAAELGVRWLTVHSCGGRAMLDAAVKAAGDDVGVLAVTVLTSLDEADLVAIGAQPPLDQLVRRRAALALDAGCAGLVCSPREVGMLREAFGPKAVLVTPGIRPTGGITGDQKRTMTPAGAVSAGADFLVVGRPVYQADDPGAAARSLVAELAIA